MEKKPRYSVGIDMGTNSVGWCVLDEHDHIVKKNGKSLWGVRLFDEAEACRDRRLHRGARRRFMRRYYRISHLQDIFAKPIAEVDPLFYKRLQQSKFLLEDKKEVGVRTLIFPDVREEARYHQLYPTIYHLRKALMEKDEKFDIRLLYLAVHHIIKYRGHFLFGEKSIRVGGGDDTSEIVAALKEINDALDDLDQLVRFDAKRIKELAKQLLVWYKESSGIKFLKTKLMEFCQPPKDKHFEVIIKMLAGSSVKVSDFFIGSGENDNESFSMKDMTDEKIEEWAGLYDPIRVGIVKNIKRIRDAMLLNRLLGKDKTLSGAMVGLYEKHKADLKFLKGLIRARKDKALYRTIFRTYDRNATFTAAKNNCNYAAYVGGSGNVHGKRCDKEDFYGFLKSKKNNFNIENYVIPHSGGRTIHDEMETGDFLPRPTSKDNSVFPYQLNKIELEKILAKQSRYHPFLRDETTRQHIVQLLTFRIPYYVGPLPGRNASEEQRKYAWRILNDGADGAILPWTFDKLINKEDTARAFIERMKNNCTYLPDRPCMSVGSLYYAYFSVLQDLNLIRVNGNALGEEEKKDIIRNVYLKKNKVSLNDLQKYLNKKEKAAVEITAAAGGDVEQIAFSGNLRPIRDFIRIFGTEKYLFEHIEKLEAIINEVTIFKDKTMLKRRLRNDYHISDDSKVKSLCALNYGKYARISRELLTMKGIDENGELCDSILDRMLKTGDNLQACLSRKEIQNQLALHTRDQVSFDVSDDDSLKKYVGDMYLSPLYKRPLIQTVKILLELERILAGGRKDARLGDSIAHFYIESTRTAKAKKGKVTTSRQAHIKSLYADCKDLAAHELSLSDLKERLAACPDPELKSKKWFLYFLQMGRDIYTGEPVDIDLCDIDHVVPQSRLPGDSLSNIVLTQKAKNSDKTDIYPLPKGFITEKGRELIEYLHAHKLIDRRKYDALLRRPEDTLKMEELQNFAARQLVATSQSVKALGDLLKDQHIEPQRVHYVKAEYVSEFRHAFDLYKSRLANNFHHAHDAYLNAVVGRVVHRYYLKQFVLGVDERQKWSADLMKPIRTIAGKHKTILRDLDGSNLFDEKMLLELKHNIQTRFDIMVTVRTYRRHGGLFDQNPVPRRAGLVPLKGRDPHLARTEVYGGYDKPSYDKFLLVSQHDGSLRLTPKDFRYDAEDAFVYRVNTKMVRGKSSAVITGVTGGSSFVINKGFEPHFDKDIYEMVAKIERLNAALADKRLATPPLGEPNYLEHLGKVKNIGIIVNEDMIQRNASNSKLAKVFSSEYDRFFEKLFAFYHMHDKQFGLFSALASAFNEENLVKIKLLPILYKQYLGVEYLKLLTRQNQTADLSAIGGKTQVGKGSFCGKFIPGDRIVFESVTGFYKWEKNIYPCK